MKPYAPANRAGRYRGVMSIHHKTAARGAVYRKAMGKICKHAARQQGKKDCTNE